MEHFLQDLRYSWRLAQSSRGSSAFIVLLLALGVGLNVAVFDLANAVFLRPLPVRAPRELVRLVTVDSRLGPRSMFTYRAYEVLREKSVSFSDVIAYSLLSTAARDDSGASSRVWCEVVTGNYFTALGVQPLHGRLLTDGDVTGRSDVFPAVLSYQYWQRHFHGDPGVVGRRLHLRDRSFTIVGVTPREFNGIEIDTTPDVRVPVTAADSLSTIPERQSYRSFDYAVVARLRPHVVLVQAQAEAETLFRAAVGSEFPDPTVALWLRDRFELQPIANGLSRLRDRYKPALYLLGGGVALLLFMICANVGGLLLARVASRRSETAVRLALGAPAGRLLRMWLTESLLLTMLGGAIGIGLAWAATPFFSRVLPPLRNADTTQLTLSIDLRPDVRVAAFALVLCLACGLLAGSPAAQQAMRSDLYSALRATRARERLRWTLVALQAMLGTLLIAVSALLLSTLRELRSLDPGFDRDHVVTFAADPGMLGYTEEQTRNLVARLVGRVEAMPGVLSVAVAHTGVMRGTGISGTVALAGQQAAPGEYVNASLHFVSPKYFETMGIRVLAGRTFRADEPERKPEPVIVNRAFTERFFPASDPVGQRFGSSFNKPAEPDFEIIGTVSDTKYRSLRERVPPTVYYRWTSKWARVFVLHARCQMRPEELIEPVRQTLADLEPRLPFYEVRTLAEDVQTSLWAELFLARASAGFSVFAVTIALLGVYGTLAYAIVQRKREIGIRMALGAGTKDILWTCSSRPMAVVGLGAVVGLIVFYVTTPVMQGLLYGISARDPWASVGAMLTMLVLALATTTVAATAALRVDPASVLREE